MRKMLRDVGAAAEGDAASQGFRNAKIISEAEFNLIRQYDKQDPFIQDGLLQRVRQRQSPLRGGVVGSPVGAAKRYHAAAALGWRALRVPVPDAAHQDQDRGQRAVHAHAH